jgi:hypothetical protein
MSVATDDVVQVRLTAGGLPQSTRALLPAGLTIDQAIAEILSGPADDIETRRVLQAIERELQAQRWEVFGRNPDGISEPLVRSCAVEDVAVERPIDPHRQDGPTSLRVAELEVIAYARVG